MLVDTGLPRDTAKLIDQMRAVGFDPAGIRFIFLTHGDTDHIGGAARFQTASKAQIIAQRADVGLIEGREPRQVASSGLGRIIRPLFGLMTSTVMKAKPVKVDRIVAEGDTLADGWRVIHLPGHTPGHTGLYHPEKRVVIAGDALRTAGGLNPPPGIFTPDMRAARASIRRLAQLDFDVLGVGHGAPITSGAGDAVRARAAALKEDKGS
jgi:glyoxylase-like metal-dependent hydrolase (beta-lactamase superfamily II)